MYFKYNFASRQILKNYIQRKKYNKAEFYRRINNGILKGKYQSLEAKGWATMLKFSKFENTSRSKNVSICLKSGRQRSVISYFKMGRWEIHKAAQTGEISGLRIISW